MLMGTPRPVKTNEVDSLGRRISVSGNTVGARATAPAPTATAGRVEVPARLAGYVVDTVGTSLQDRLDELGWESATWLRLEGEQCYDDQQYHTPSWTLALRGDLDPSTLGRQVNAAARTQAARDGLDDPDDIERFVEEQSGTYWLEGGEMSAEALAEHGIVEMWQPARDDPFSDLHVDDLDFDDDEGEVAG